MSAMMYKEMKVSKKNGLTYVKNGEHWIPMIAIPESEAGPPLTRFGKERFRFLKEHRPFDFEMHRCKADLISHCREVEQRAETMYDRLMMELPETVGATEELKQQDQLKWVGLMENCHARAIEIVNRELIYV